MAIAFVNLVVAALCMTALMTLTLTEAGVSGLHIRIVAATIMCVSLVITAVIRVREGREMKRLRRNKSTRA